MAKANLQAGATGVVVSITVAVGDRIKAGDIIVVLESMKMEIPVTATQSGTVSEILVQEKQAVDETQTVIVLEV
jgi:biotin carboxyl carrier protein